MNSKQVKKYFSRKKKNRLILLFIGLIILIVIAYAIAYQYIPYIEKIEQERNSLKGGAIGVNAFPGNPQLEDDNLSFYYEIKPGTSLEDTIILYNFKDTSNRVLAYITSVNKNPENQTLTHSSFQDEQKEVSKWITFNNKIKDNIYKFSPDEKKPVEITINIPKNTTPGEYIGGIAVEKIGKQVEGKINANFRIVSNIKIKVTDSPKEFIRHKVTVFTPTIFFWSSLILFLLSLFYFIRTKKKNK